MSEDRSEADTCGYHHAKTYKPNKSITDKDNIVSALIEEQYGVFHERPLVPHARVRMVPGSHGISAYRIKQVKHSSLDVRKCRSDEIGIGERNSLRLFVHIPYERSHLFI